MWWECSECGGHVGRERPPVVCRSCGTAGVIFTRVEATEVLGDDDDMRAVWLRAGLERDHAVPWTR